jgi:hypothetical protein
MSLSIPSTKKEKKSVTLDYTYTLIDLGQNAAYPGETRSKS